MCLASVYSNDSLIGSFPLHRVRLSTLAIGKRLPKYISIDHYSMSAPRNFISIPHTELSPDRTTRYRVTLDLTLEDDPTLWDWEDLLEIEDPEKVNNVTFEEFL